LLINHFFNFRYLVFVDHDLVINVLTHYFYELNLIYSSPSLLVFDHNFLSLFGFFLFIIIELYFLNHEAITQKQVYLTLRYRLIFYFINLVTKKI
jgi:hypothetical protein